MLREKARSQFRKNVILGVRKQCWTVCVGKLEKMNKTHPNCKNTPWEDLVTRRAYKERFIS